MPHCRLKNLSTTDAMKKSFLGSATFHAAILLAALFGLPVAKMAEIIPPEAIQVDISNITDNTKVKAQTKSDEPPSEKPKPKASKAIEKVKPKEKVADEVKLAAKEPSKTEPPPEPPKPEPPKPKPPKLEPKVEPPPKKVEDLPVDPDPLKAMLAAEEKKVEEEKKAEEKKQAAEKKKADKKLADKKAAPPPELRANILDFYINQPIQLSDKARQELQALKQSN